MSTRNVACHTRPLQPLHLDWWINWHSLVQLHLWLLVFCFTRCVLAMRMMPIFEIVVSSTKNWFLSFIFRWHQIDIRVSLVIWLFLWQPTLPCNFFRIQCLSMFILVFFSRNNRLQMQFYASSGLHSNFCLKSYRNGTGISFFYSSSNLIINLISHFGFLKIMKIVLRFLLIQNSSWMRHHVKN